MMKFSFRRYTLHGFYGLLIMGIASGCINRPRVISTKVLPSTLHPPQEDEDDLIPDPMEKMNRFFFQFNLVLDRTLIGAFCVLFENLPKFVRQGLRCWVSTWSSPIYILNALAQNNPSLAKQHAKRWIINVICGAGGFIDCAEKAYHLTPEPMGFSQTLEKGSWSSGPYLVLPFLGPCCVRELCGRFLDFGAQPLSYHYPTADAYYALLYLQLKNESRKKLSFLDGETDPYTCIKMLYSDLQRGTDEENQNAEKI